MLIIAQLYKKRMKFVYIVVTQKNSCISEIIKKKKVFKISSAEKLFTISYALNEYLTDSDNFV